MEDVKASVMVAQPVPEPEQEQDSPALDRDAILAASDLDIVKVDVPAWGGSVCIRTVPGTERDKFINTCQNRKRGDKIDVRGLKSMLLVQVLCNEQGERLFTAGDADALDKKSSKVLEELFEKAQDINGLSDKEIEELAEN